jgi:hypothetical protein
MGSEPKHVACRWPMLCCSCSSFRRSSYIYVSFFIFLSLCIFNVPVGTLRLPWLRCFGPFSSGVRQMPGSNSQRRGTARTLPKFLFSTYCLFCIVLCIVCKCVPYYCHRVATQLQFTNISHHIIRQCVTTTLSHSSQPRNITCTISFSL